MSDAAHREVTPRVWSLAGAAALASFTLMAVEVLRADLYGRTALLAIAVIALMAGAVGLYRIAPGPALATVWVAGAMQVIGGAPLLLTQASVALIAYGAARYGSRWSLWLSVAALPVGVVIAMEAVAYGAVWPSMLVTEFIEISSVRLSSRVTLVALAVPLLAPWVLGILLRLRDRARRSDRAVEQARRDEEAALERAQQAQELAELRDGQARLARDVHDVVGHSLTVILAQAQSAQYLDSNLHPDVQRALTAIASTARASLAEVRAILTPSASSPDRASADAGVRHDFEALLEDVEAAGVVIDAEVLGQPRALAPDLSVTLYRVLQEMLTNVLKHGSREVAVRVRFDWRTGLVVAVTNSVSATAAHGENDATSQGLTGMTQRMEAVGGTLVVSRAADTFTVTATFPPAHSPDDRGTP